MKKFALGVAIAAVGVATQSIPAYADKLDDVLSRLDAIEQNNKRLAKENADLRARLNKGESARSTAPVANTPAARAASMTATPTPPRSLTAPEIDVNGHGFLEHKKGNPLTFYTPGGEITGYGNIDLSVDDTTKAFGGNIDTNPAFTGGSEPFPAGNFGWMPAISSNSSYLGVRGFQNLPNFPANFVYQLEVGFDVSSTPGLKQTNSQVSENTNGSLFNRNTYIGFASPEFGAIKIGKTTAPYENSTGGFNPFAGQIGDMRVVMGNTGGDNRVEFGGRLDHSIWYESPTIAGFQFNALFSPGQNRSTISDNIPAGGSDCAGGNDPTSGGLFPNGCNDGAFSNAYSANLSYTNGPFYATVAYERHTNVNRQSDISGIYAVGSSAQTTFQLVNCPVGGAGCFPNAAQLAAFNADVADEDAFKVAALYTFSTKTTVGGIFEMMHRYVSPLIQFQNERTRNGTWAFLTQELTPQDSASFGWAHAFKGNGDPGQHNSVPTATPIPGSLGTDCGAGCGLTAFANDNAADMVTSTYKHKFGSNLTWYTAVAATINGPNAHYDLGAGGHGVTTDCHSAFGASGGLVSQPHCWVGPTLAGVSTGLQWRF
ncbi:porin [Bradyrhizobium sp.]|uniref:porin n=1 Tax=Bradyrhizobium sp. TaxID=376 RepID=UPI0025BCCEE0|nr:porin [Bradyrhizobium sp.]